MCRQRYRKILKFSTKSLSDLESNLAKSCCGWQQMWQHHKLKKEKEKHNTLAYTYLVSISQRSSSFVGHRHYIINIHPLVGKWKYKRELKKSTNLLNDLCQFVVRVWSLCGSRNYLQPAFAFTFGCGYSSSRSHLYDKTLTRWPISMHLASQNFPTFDCGCSQWSPCTVVVYLDLALSLSWTETFALEAVA